MASTQTQVRSRRKVKHERHHDAGAWALALPDGGLLAVGQQLFEGKRPKTTLSLTGRSVLLPRMERAVQDRTVCTEVAWFDHIPWAIYVEPIICAATDMVVAVRACYINAADALTTPPANNADDHLWVRIDVADTSAAVAFPAPPQVGTWAHVTDPVGVCAWDYPVFELAGIAPEAAQWDERIGWWWPVPQLLTTAVHPADQWALYDVLRRMSQARHSCPVIHGYRYVPSDGGAERAVRFAGWRLTPPPESSGGDGPQLGGPSTVHGVIHATRPDQIRPAARGLAVDAGTALLNSIPNVVIDPGDEIIASFSNPLVELAEVPANRRVRELIHPDRVDDVLEVCRAVSASGQQQTMLAVPVRGPNQTWADHDLTALPIREDDKGARSPYVLCTLS